MNNIYEILKAINNGIVPGTGENVNLEDIRTGEVRKELIRLAETAGLVMGEAAASKTEKTVAAKVLDGLKEWRKTKAEGFGLPEEAILEDVLLKDISDAQLEKREDLLAHGLLPEGKYEIFGAEIYEVVANLT